MAEFDMCKVTLVRESALTYGFDTHITDPDSVYNIAKVLGMDSAAEEELYMICLDCKGAIAGVHLVSKGSLTSAIIHPREVYKRACINNAKSIILMHNHPSGSVLPSKEDLDITKRLKEAGDVLGIELLDHLIIGYEEFLSFSQKGLL